MKKNPPLIGLTLDADAPSGLSKFARYSIRENYCGAISAVGGIPICLPHGIEALDALAERLDGLVVTGGAFDIDPTLYGDNNRHVTVATKEGRTAFEWAITKVMLARDKPVLGICGGEQLLNVMLGGTLIQHIEDAVQGHVLHEQPNPRDEAGHEVKVTPGSLLHRICGSDRLMVNSAHHQAVKAAGPGIVVNAVAADGVVEGIEDPGKRFCLGVQWHPEFIVNPGDAKIVEALVAAARP
ncbi:MAG: gamma-glutamyl-gamma-aminobutyrate hydrolase family protein [Dongiaceae bacterium]